MKIELTAFDLAQRYIGIAELANGDHPLIQWWLSLVAQPLDGPDETPWCSAFTSAIAWELRLPRSKSAAARSWLEVGTPVAYPHMAEVGFDICVFKRGTQAWQGHVGFYAGLEGNSQRILILGGNQGNKVSIAAFPTTDLLGIRRLAPATVIK